jgi:hypothetical protein
MSWTKFFKPVNSVLPQQSSPSASSGGATALNKFSSWLPEFYQGPPNRLMRYMQYEQMDLDHEVSAAMDTIADFSTAINVTTQTPFDIKYTKDASTSEKEILVAALRQWSNLNEFQKRAWRLFRSTLMYGDQFLIRDPETFKLHWVDPSTVEKVLVNESEGKAIEAYYIRELDLNLQSLTATNTFKKTEMGYNAQDTIFPNAPYTGQANYSTGSASGMISTSGSQYSNAEAFPVDAQHVVQLSMTEGMNSSWPFGISILETIFKVYKQKELLEDSILIYRVHRAPERRIFYIDVGTMPPNKAAQYLERIRYEVQQKRIPSRTGGGESITDSAYNPMSMLEDYFFAATADGRGSKVDTLPGGDNLGEIDDLKYFNNKMLRGLGVPSSYLPTGPDDGSSAYNDGRVGTAFIQEFRFSKVCQRHQRQIVPTLDQEFKLFLKHRGFTIDSSIFELELEEPQNFSEYRQIEIDAAYANLFSQMKDVPYMSKRWAMKRYLGLNETEIAENEKLWRQEQAVPHATEDSGAVADLRSVGVGGEDFGDFEGEEGEEDFGDEDIGDGGDIPGGEGEGAEIDLEA